MNTHILKCAVLGCRWQLNRSKLQTSGRSSGNTGPRRLNTQKGGRTTQQVAESRAAGASAQSNALRRRSSSCSREQKRGPPLDESLSMALLEHCFCLPWDSPIPPGSRAVAVAARPALDRPPVDKARSKLQPSSLLVATLWCLPRLRPSASHTRPPQLCHRLRFLMGCVCILHILYT